MNLRLVIVVPRLRNNVLERTPNHSSGTLELWFLERADDLDPELAASADLQLLRKSTLSACRDLFRDPPDMLELPEPYWFRFLPIAILMNVATKLGAFVRRRPAPVVFSYVMENLPVQRGLDARRLGLPRPMSRIFINAMSRVLRLWDCLPAATPAARSNYLGLRPDADAPLFLELMPRCTKCPPVEKEPTVLFAAEFTQRKGVDRLMAAWDEVAPGAPKWNLRLFVYGEGIHIAHRWAKTRPGVDVVVGATRQELHAAFATAAVVILPSVPSAYWLEQVGYPVLEGLAHGCRIIATSDSGLAGWLSEQGHLILDGSRDVAGCLELAMASSELGLPTPLPDLDARQRVELYVTSLAEQRLRPSSGTRS